MFLKALVLGCARVSPNARALSIFRCAHRKAHMLAAVCVIYESEQTLTLHIRLSNKNDDDDHGITDARSPFKPHRLAASEPKPNNPSNCSIKFIGGGRRCAHEL